MSQGLISPTGHMKHTKRLFTLYVPGRAHATAPIAGRMQGVLQTTWTGIGQFAGAYFEEVKQPTASVSEAVSCFRTLFREIRAQDGK